MNYYSLSICLVSSLLLTKPLKASDTQSQIFNNINNALNNFSNSSTINTLSTISYSDFNTVFPSHYSLNNTAWYGYGVLTDNVDGFILSKKFVIGIYDYYVISTFSNGCFITTKTPGVTIAGTQVKDNSGNWIKTNNAYLTPITIEIDANTFSGNSIQIGIYRNSRTDNTAPLRVEYPKNFNFTLSAALLKKIKSLITPSNRAALFTSQVKACHQATQNYINQQIKQKTSVSKTGPFYFHFECSNPGIFLEQYKYMLLTTPFTSPIDPNYLLNNYSPKNGNDNPEMGLLRLSMETSSKNSNGNYIVPYYFYLNPQNMIKKIPITYTLMNDSPNYALTTPLTLPMFFDINAYAEYLFKNGTLTQLDQDISNQILNVNTLYDYTKNGETQITPLMALFTFPETPAISDGISASFITQQADPTVQSKKLKQNALMFALLNNNSVNTIQLLLTSINDKTKLATMINQQNYTGESALLMAVNLANKNKSNSTYLNEITKIIQLLIQYGANPNSGDTNSNTPLTLALTNQLNTITTILEQSPLIGTSDSNGMNSLMYAAQSGNNNLVTQLIGLKNSNNQPVFAINNKDKNKYNALYYAVQSGNNDCVQTLLNAGITIDASTVIFANNQNNSTIFNTLSNYVSNLGNTINNALIANDATTVPTALNSINQFKNCISVMNLFSQNNYAFTSPLQITSSGFTPLMLAVSYNQSDIVDALLSLGDNPNYIANNLSALSIAIYLDYKTIIEKLINAGAILTPEIIQIIQNFAISKGNLKSQLGLNYAQKLIKAKNTARINGIIKQILNKEKNFQNVDLSGADLQKMDLSEINFSNANLQNANLSGANLSSTILTGANLSGAHLSGANLTWTTANNTNFTSAILTGATLTPCHHLNGADFNGANLTHTNLFGIVTDGIKNLDKAVLTGANLSSSSKTNYTIIDLSNMQLQNKDLSGVNFSGTNLSNSNLSGCNMSSTILTGANLSGANLSGTNLTWTSADNANFTNANLTEATMTPCHHVNGADFTKTNLTKANLSGMITTGIKNLNKAVLTGTNLSGANLSNIDLSNMNLSGNNLSSTILTGANLSGANLAGADLTWTTADTTNFSNANLTGATMTPCHHLNGANFNKANLTNANLSDIVTTGIKNLNKAVLTGTNLSGTDLTKINLSGIQIKHTNLRNINVSNSTLNQANLMYTDLTNANLQNAQLKNSNMNSTILNGANLSGANLAGADLTWTTANNTNFSNANLTGATMTPSHHLNGANFNGANLTRFNLSGSIANGAIFTNTTTKGMISNTVTFDGTTIMPNGKPYSNNNQFK